MNERSISEGRGLSVCADGPWADRRTGSEQRHGVGYFSQQRVGVYLRGGGVSSTLMARDYKSASDLVVEELIVYPGVGITSSANGSNPKPGDPSPTLSTDSRNYLVDDGKPPSKYIVRRLTPLECCRLQGFPDWWEDGAEGSDSARYRMWGNGIALPCAVDVLGRIAREVMDNA